MASPIAIPTTAQAAGAGAGAGEAESPIPTQATREETAGVDAHAATRIREIASVLAAAADLTATFQASRTPDLSLDRLGVLLSR